MAFKSPVYALCTAKIWRINHRFAAIERIEKGAGKWKIIPFDARFAEAHNVGMGRPGKFFSIMFSEWASGLSGPASVPFAVLALFATGAVLKFAYGLLAIMLGFFSAYRIWLKENDETEIARREVAELKAKYFDERPVLGLNIVGSVGPKQWKDAAASRNTPIHLSIQNLSGRVATSIHFKPILSKLGKFSLHFDSLAHIKPQMPPTSLTLEIQEEGYSRVNARDRDTIGNIDATLLGYFLDDRDRNNGPQIEVYELIATFRDGAEQRSQPFYLKFDWERYCFQRNTNPDPPPM